MHCAPEQLALVLPDGGQHGMLMPWQCIAGVTAAQAAVTVTSQMAVNARARTLETRRWTHPFTKSAYTRKVRGESDGGHGLWGSRYIFSANSGCVERTRCGVITIASLE